MREVDRDTVEAARGMGMRAIQLLRRVELPLALPLILAGIRLAVDEPIVLAAAPDCPERQDCRLGLEETYGIEISRVEPLGFGTVQTKDALKSGEVQLGQVGTSDASTESLGLVVLEDDKGLQNAENLTPVVNLEFLDANPEVANVLNELSGALTTEDLKSLNAKVDIERQLPEDVARDYLTEEGLV